MIALTIFSLIVLLFSVIIHEIAHGSVAIFLGDTTAKREGRLTLNPIKHIDLFGTIILPLLLMISRSGFIFGWAKPVPINPYNFKDQKWGMLKVSLAGPLSNLSIAVIFGLIIRFINLPASLIVHFSIIVYYNFLLAIFNLFPIPPLDGSHILFSFFPEKWNNVRNFIFQYGIIILIFFLFLGPSFLYRIVDSFYYLVTGINLII